MLRSVYRVATKHRNYSAIVEPVVQGTLAEHDDVPIVRQADGSAEYTPLSKSDRFDPRTLAARSPSPSMLYIPEALAENINEFSRRWDPQQVRQRVSKMYKDLSDGKTHEPSNESIDVEAIVLGTFLQTYASISSVLQEVSARRPDFKPKSMLDVGYGPATGVLAASQVFESLERKVGVILGHPRMPRRANQLLKAMEDETTSLKTEMPLPTSINRYDLVIATHQLYQPGVTGQEVVDAHTQRLVNLLNPGGMLVLVERGDPTGFEAVARARQVIIRPENRNDAQLEWIKRTSPAPESQESAIRIVAPCSHHGKCPLQVGLLARQNMKNAASQNWCRFTQNVQRPHFAMELKKGQYLAQPWVASDGDGEYSRGKGGKSLAGRGRPFGKANEEASYSYLAIERAKSTTEAALASNQTETLPRILRHPMKRHGHVLMEMCAPSGNIEHWTVTKSQGKQEYHDARKASGGDLWALDAKTKQLRGGLKKRPDGELALESEAEAKDHWSKPKNEPESLFDHLTLLDAEGMKKERSEKVVRRSKQKLYSKWSQRSRRARK